MKPAYIGAVILLIGSLSSCKDQCFEYFYFEFPTDNTLSSEELQIGENFRLRIEIPFEAIAHDGTEQDISDREFITAITFKEYISPQRAVHTQLAAIDDFTYKIITGDEIAATFAQLAGDTENHSIYCLPALIAGTRMIEIQITPLTEGIFYLFFQSANEIADEEGQNLDGDDCYDSVVYGFKNLTKNNFSFLEGEIQNPGPQSGEFLESWSGIAFKVID